MKIVSIIDRHQEDVVENILKHCDLWNDPDPPLAQNLFDAEREFTEEVIIDLDFFDMIALDFKSHWVSYILDSHLT